jgi:hypothetical protein
MKHLEAALKRMAIGLFFLLAIAYAILGVFVLWLR